VHHIRYTQSMDSADLPIRTGTADDFGAISDLLGLAFHHTIDRATRDVEGAVFEPERSLVVADAGAVVGHAAAYSRELTVPGGPVPAAYVTLVVVAPTHRRQGLLNRMMRRQLTDIASAGREPVAVLWASEGKIYQRYGYGLASQRLELEVATREIRPPQTPLADGAKLRLVEPADAVAEFAKVYEQLRIDRPGYASRDDRWWQCRVFDPESERDGGTALHGVVHDTPHGPTGYALWRTKGEWDAKGPKAQVQIREVVAADPGAYAALWRLLLTIDLARSATFAFAALDEPLVYLVDEPRQLGPRTLDGLWVRLIDVPRALAARRYPADVDIVLDVTDAHIPGNTGRWRLTGGPACATCSATADPADLACTVLELGSAYLGGPSLGALAAAGRVRELTPGALARASAAFGWHRMPVAIEVF
jgi:predicted acetyltransferase